MFFFNILRKSLERLGERKKIEKTAVSASKIDVRASQGGLGTALGGLRCVLGGLADPWGDPPWRILGFPKEKPLGRPSRIHGSREAS